MKFLGIQNGWKVAPHCWTHFIARLICIEKTPGWFSIEIIGFVFFFGE